METKELQKNIYVWLIIAFIVGFAFNQFLTVLNINPLNSRAGYQGAEFGGLPFDCSGFNYEVDYRCMPVNNQGNDFDFSSGGGNYTPPTQTAPPAPVNDCFYTDTCDSYGKDR